MADDEVQKAGLEWVAEPAVVDGSIVYTYRNSGTATATVHEMINVLPKEGAGEVQMFQLPGVEAGAEHTTRAPSSPEFADGPVTVYVTIQAESGGSDWDAKLEAEAKAAIRAGALVAAGDGANTDAPPLAVAVSGIRLDGHDLVMTYHFTGGGPTLFVSVFVSLMHDGTARWNSAEIQGSDREDVARVSVPTDVVDSDGWILEAVVSGVTEGEVQTGARVTMQLDRADDGTVTDGGHSVLSIE